jgi:hypothetical protein
MLQHNTMGFDVQHWGPYFWSVIHIVALGAPPDMRSDETRRADLAKFYNALPGVLPCGVCGRHLAEHLKEMPVEDHLDGRQSLFDWTVTLHNAVNRTTGRTQEMSTADAYEYWKGVCLAENGVKINRSDGSSIGFSKNTLYTLAMLVVGVVALVILYRVFIAPSRR